MQLTFSQISTFVVIVGALIGAYNLISTALKNKREQDAIRNQPLNDVRDKLTAQAAMLDRDKKRLEKMDEIIEGQREQLEKLDDGINILMRSMLETVRHERHGNNMEGLERAEAGIMNYLTGGDRRNGGNT